MTMIPVEMIDPPAWNSRLPKSGTLGKAENAKIDALAASLDKDGQLTAIEVEQKGERFELVFGSRRVAAAKILKWTQINAEVRAPSSASDKIYRNIIENAQRENLTSFELARASAQLRDLGLKNPEISGKLGISPSHVSNLNTTFKGLPAPVLKDWERGEPAATGAAGGPLHDIATKCKTDEDKVRAWDERVASVAEASAAGQKPGKRGKAKDKAGSSSSGLPVSQKRLAYCLEVLSSKAGTPDLTDEVRKWTKTVLDFIVQGRANPPNGIPKMPVKGTKDKDAE